MNVLQILQSEIFSDLDQFQRKKLLKNYILQDNQCKIGSRVLCFQKEILIGEQNKWMYKKYGKNKIVTTISVGKQYEIIEHKESKIKLINNDGKKMWYSIDRFLYSLKIERKEKLKKINLCQTE